MRFKLAGSNCKVTIVRGIGANAQSKIDLARQQRSMLREKASLLLMSPNDWTEVMFI